ncbi:uncharacterized protein LOC144123497 [Amblyomma americanum]
MGTRQRHPATASHGGHRYQQLAQQHHEEQWAIHERDHGDEELDDQASDETDDTFDAAFVPWLSMGQPPFHFLPPPPTEFPDEEFPFGPYVSVEEGEEYATREYTRAGEQYASYAIEYPEGSNFEHQDELVFYEHDLDQVRQLQYVQLLQASALQGPSADAPEEDDSGTGEPHGSVASDESSPHVMGTEGCGDAQIVPVAHEENPWQGLLDSYYGPLVTNYATVTVIMKHHVRVDFSLDHSVRVVNFATHCMAAMSSSGDRTCVCHPGGRVLQEGDNVDIATGTRVAKISGRGITFTALNHGLVYLVDASGTKSTTERFQNLSYDLASSVFHFDLNPSAELYNECLQIINQARLRTTRNGDEIWVLGGVRIKQTPWGDVQVSCDSGRRVMWTSPTAGSVSVTTAHVKIALTCDPTKYFFVRMGQRRLSSNEDGFIVRNGSQRAGFDSQGRLTLP